MLKSRVFLSVLSLACLSCLTLTGCGLVPKQRLDDSQKVIDGLRAENAQLKDAALGLRTQNQDLNQRALDDARRIAALEEARGQLEKSVQAYIDEREALNDAFQQFKREAVAQIRSQSERVR
jgi:cell division protein FtsB